MLALPLGLGKANHIANALFAKAVADRSIALTIFTALTLEPPRANSDPPDEDQVLYQVSRAVLAVTKQLSVRDVLQVIVRSARSLSAARYAALGVPDAQGSFAEFVVDGITARQQKAIGPLPRQHGMLAALLKESKPQRLADIRADPRFGGWWHQLQSDP